MHYETQCWNSSLECEGKGVTSREREYPLKTPDKTRNMTLVLTRKKENQQRMDEGEDSLDLIAINFLSRSVRTRSGRVISLSHRALASYQ